MQLVTDNPITTDEKRFEIFKLLWRQSYGPKRMLEYAIREKLFNPSQLALAETEEGLAKLETQVRKEFRKINTTIIDVRRDVIIQLLALGLTKREITRHCVDKNLVPSLTPESAYHCVRKDITRMVQKMRAEDLEFLPAAKSVYIRQQNQIFRDALSGSTSAAAEGDRRGQAALLNTAMKASENMGIVRKVDVTGRQQEIQKGFDLATEAALAVIEHAKKVKQLADDRDDDRDYRQLPPSRAVIDVGGDRETD